MDSANQVGTASPAITAETFTGTLGRHLARRLIQIGVKDVFSVPDNKELSPSALSSVTVNTSLVEELLVAYYHVSLDYHVIWGSSDFTHQFLPQPLCWHHLGGTIFNPISWLCW
ncbi:hypothetical protein AgCh_022898 [Apium graveolens]